MLCELSISNFALIERQSVSFGPGLNVISGETGAKLNGGVRAKKVTIAGELEGNIESASRVELLASGVLVGDVKAGSLTVAAGSRMRGQADFGWDEPAKAGKGGGTEPGTAA